MKIAIGNDHAAVELKEIILQYLKDKGHELVNEGTDSSDSVDYPDFAKAVALDVVNENADFGILICGTGIGVSIAANKVPGIRAAVCHDAVTAQLAKEHNNANIVTFGARVIDEKTAKEIVDAYINAEYEGGRHQQRLDKITALEEEFKS